MNADADLQVWLETSSVAQTSIIIPHVQSETERQVTYRITTTREGPSGRSSIGQSGEVLLQAAHATALSRMAIRRETDDTCRITLVLSEAETSEHRYEFECPDKDGRQTSR